MPRRSISRFKDPMAGAKAASFPGFVTPCDPTLREQAPAGADWLHEIKIDGYRA
jgi:bifunctional non-homologous end joining protein LigD